MLTDENTNRLRASQGGSPRPAEPKDVLTRCWATVIALARETSYLQVTPVAAWWVRVPPFGTIYFIVAYLVFILALQFVDNDVAGAQHYQALAVRAGWLAIAQIPLLVLLAGKNNLIGLLSGVSYERLNVYHRWIARGLLLLSTIHFGTQSYGWNQYGLMQLEWATDACAPTGIAAYAILLWMNLTTLAPLRNLSYDFFVAQHILTFFGFIIAMMLHLPTTAIYSRTYIYIPIALYLVERIVRTARYVYNNVRPGRATLEALEGEATKVRVSSRQVRRWAPGAHVLLSIPWHAPFQSHPATIVSTPTSHNGDMVFILRAYGGFTKRIWKAAERNRTDASKKEEGNAALQQTRIALIDGPYRASHADFACFDTLFLIAGASGVTFTASVLLDISHRATARKLPLRAIHFIWMIKKRSWLSWVAEELQTAADQLAKAGIEFRVTTFVTCDDAMVEFRGPRGNQAAECQCEESSNYNDTDAISLVRGGGQEGLKSKDGAILTTRSSTEGSDEEKVDSRCACAVLRSGRPVFDSLLWEPLCRAEGESAVAVCGPLSMSAAVRRTVVNISDERAVHKGSGAQGIYLHVENFS
jgi:ferric-chelate reductase